MHLLDLLEAKDARNTKLVAFSTISSVSTEFFSPKQPFFSSSLSFPSLLPSLMVKHERIQIYLHLV